MKLSPAALFVAAIFVALSLTEVTEHQYQTDVVPVAGVLFFPWVKPPKMPAAGLLSYMFPVP